jgi:hypothetical protein
MIGSWKVLSVFRRRHADPQSAAQRLHADVLACTHELGRKLPPLAKRYSMQAFTLALAMHLRATLILGLKEGHLTEEQVTRLVRSLLSTDGESSDEEMLEAMRSTRVP